MVAAQDNGYGTLLERGEDRLVHPGADLGDVLDVPFALGPGRPRFLTRGGEITVIRGRRPYPLGVMLRVHCVQLFYNLSDPGMEDLLYDLVAQAGNAVTEAANSNRRGPHVDAPPTTAANAADVTQACVLLHGDETEAWGDAGYQGVDKRPENRGCGVAWQVAMKPGKRRLLDRDGAEAAAEKRKASVRAKVEHPFLYVKRRFGYGKVRYRGLAKNTQRIALLLGFSNLLIAGRYATG